jgi:protein gp37
MGEATGISWCHSTFNPWWGCTPISPGCDRCYAEIFAHRMGLEWGKDAPRRFFGEKHWREPLRWNKKAGEAGERWRVFCGSMCDILDNWYGKPIFGSDKDRDYWDREVYGRVGKWLSTARLKLWDLIEVTPNLDWLLVSKRPQNYPQMLPDRWIQPPRNLWLMTTVESPEYLWRLKSLAQVPAVVHGVSWEPGLAYVDFKPYADIHNLWVIGGGESCPGARPFELDWARRVRDDCREIEVPFFLKQLGGYPDKRDNPTLWPSDLQVQQFPRVR